MIVGPRQPLVKQVGMQSSNFFFSPALATPNLILKQVTVRLKSAASSATRASGMF